MDCANPCHLQVKNISDYLQPPPEILKKIFGHLNINSLRSAAFVNRLWKKLVLEVVKGDKILLFKKLSSFLQKHIDQEFYDKKVQLDAIFQVLDGLHNAESLKMIFEEVDRIKRQAVEILKTFNFRAVKYLQDSAREWDPKSTAYEILYTAKIYSELSEIGIIRTQKLKEGCLWVLANETICKGYLSIAENIALSISDKNIKERLFVKIKNSAKAKKRLNRAQKTGNIFGKSVAFQSP